ncbi:hypothetical protein E4U43_000132 [Claviceps pusilla]|uniref:Myb-like DNA-binding domain-containing protein n=1 Tax=Claviceps pusilla TaxID=123648 RepID=A0A9P7NCE7_9HYPO|nr:hypothetical protein E4U43_000132 [Claviceps pusilla]
MAPNSDNAMARFLFAILKQKNLKDIDWNQVAQDPVLLQPITNGHAARMRYSRFRATVTGHEPQKRSRVGDKDRVSKPYKREGSSKKNVIKSEFESAVSLSSLAQLSPASLASPYSDDFGSRFLTPCSDDMASVCARAVEKRQIRKALDTYSPMIDGQSDLFTDPGSLIHSPEFSDFEAAHDLNNYNDTSTGLQSPGIADHHDAQSLIDHSHEWSDRFHDPELFSYPA